MAKNFFTSGRISPGMKRRVNDDVKPIRPQYSEMGGPGGYTASGGAPTGSGGNSAANAGGGGYAGGFFGAQGGSGGYAQAGHANYHSGEGTSGEGSADNHGGNTGGGNTGGGNMGGYDAGSFEDYYSRLIAALHSYGIDMALPTLDELYSQLSAFLRPSVDAAIAGRQRYGETVMAELDADAYSRGMGSSSYLSSMKNREYDDIANDIAAMETNYNSTLAEYLYNASNELASIQTRFAEMRRQHELEMERQLQQQAYENERLRRQQEFEAEQERLRRAYEMERLRQQQEFERAMRLQAASAASGGSGGGHGSGSGGSGGSGSSGSSGGSGGSGGGSGKPKPNKPGAAGSGGSGGYTDAGTGDSAHYYNYSVYLNSLSSADRASVFGSNSSYWSAIREELMRNLSPDQYERLRRQYDPHYSQGGGGGTSSGQAPGRPWNVNTTN